MKPLTNVPTIKGSAQARLLLYKLIKGKLTESERQLLDSDPALWQRILEMREKSIESSVILKADQIVLGTVFSHIEKSTTDGLQTQIKRITKQSLWIVRHSSVLLDAFVTEHSQLIKAVQREQLDKIKLAINRGIRDGRLHKDMAKEIRGVTGISVRRAQLIARNAPLQYSGVLTKHHQVSAGITSYIWQSSRDERVRDRHRKLDGEIFDWNGSGPHPRSEVNCRCDAVPVLD